MIGKFFICVSQWRWDRYVVCLAATLVVAMAGCNSDRLPTHPVSGTLEFKDGSFPMFGEIEFFNEANKINARGKINRDGSFSLTTYEESDGAVEGFHKIAIFQVTNDPLMAKYGDQIVHDHGDLVDPKYFDYRTSDLEWTISPGENEVKLTIRKSKNQKPRKKLHKH